MSEEDDLDGLAAEYVLGSLDPGERKQVEFRRQSDRVLAGAIEVWERRLGPLSDRVPGVAPPSHVLDRILSLVSRQAPSVRSAEVIPLHRKSRRPRALVFRSALAACVALA